MQTILSITIHATYKGEEYVPGTCDVSETVTLEIPVMDPKYVVLPKVLEGATTSVIEKHKSNVSTHLAKQRKEEEERRNMHLWENGASE